jgi:diacylglycerol kinase (ATP)
MCCLGEIPQNMKIALIHNPNAFRGEANGTDLRRVFERAGHDVAYVSTEESDWRRVISPEIARAVIVGGDGTVQSVAPNLKGTPFSILPFGTANNIAHCLHQTSDPELLASQLDEAEIRPLDLGRVTHRSGTQTFLEATGAGVFVELIRTMQKWPKKVELEQAESRKEKFAHALQQLQTITREYEGMELELKVDDSIIKDRFILLAAMNTELIGPKLHLAPDADPIDGFLDLVFVREEHRAKFCRWLECQLPGQKHAAQLENRRCRRVEVCGGNIAPVHIDSDLVQSWNFPFTIELEPAALQYLGLKRTKKQRPGRGQ